MKKKKIPKIQLQNEQGKFVWLTERQIINRIKKNEYYRPTKRTNVDLTELYEFYSPEIKLPFELTEKKKGKRQTKTEKIKDTISGAIEKIKVTDKQKQKKLQGRKRELIKETIENLPVNSVPSKFADSEAYANKQIELGKIKRYPDSNFEVKRLDGSTYTTTNRVDFINEFNSEIQKLYDVIDLILDSEDSEKISSPQFFTSGYLFNQNGFIIVGGFADFTKTEIRGCSPELFKTYYNFYVQDDQ